MIVVFLIFLIFKTQSLWHHYFKLKFIVGVGEFYFLQERASGES